MANRFGWNELQSKENLLARLMRLFYIIPPVVIETPVTHQRGQLMRFNLPVSRAQRNSGRAREQNGANDEESGLEPSDSSSASATEESCKSHDTADADSDSDPASTLRRGSGPGRVAKFASANARSAPELNGCNCHCDCCRSSRRDWLLPRAASTFMPLWQKSAKAKPRLRVIKNSDECVLGELSSGYVLKGKGRVKGGS